MIQTDAIKILIVDDQHLFANAMTHLLNSFEDVLVMGHVSNGADLFTFLDQNPVDVVLLDVEIPSYLGDDGFQIAKKLLARSQYESIKIIALSVNTQSYVIRRMVKEIGVHGYMDKNTTTPDLLQNGIQVVMRDQIYISPNLKNKLMRILNVEHLTRREIEILELIVNGASNRNIAETLFIAEKTVDNHRQSIYRKLQCNKVSELAQMYYRHMYLQNDDPHYLPQFKTTMKNTETTAYNLSILTKYKNERHTVLKQYLSNPTPANIKRRLLEVVNSSDFGKDDERIVRNFLNLSADDSLLQGIKRDTEIYKAVQHFLLGKTERSNKPGLTDLAALLVDHYPRPGSLKKVVNSEPISPYFSAPTPPEHTPGNPRTINQYGNNCIYIENNSGPIKEP